MRCQNFERDPRGATWRAVAAAGVCAASILWTPPVEAQPATAAPAAAQPAELAETPLEDLLEMRVDTVFAASRFAQLVARAPASVSIITREEIRSHGYRTLADILRSVRGFYVSYDRDYSYLGVRGFARPGDYNSRILVLLNGHRLNDTIFEAALLGTESPLDVAVFERVEVIRGPSSSLYGTSAFFGVVNIITRSGRALDGVEIQADVGSQAARSGRLTAGGRTAKGLDGFVSATAFSVSGHRQLYYPEFDTSESDGMAYDADGDRGRSVYASAALRGLQLQASYGSRRKTVPTAAFDTTFNDPRTHTEDSRAFVDLQFTGRPRPRTTVQARLAYDWYGYDGTYAYDSGLFVDGARGQWLTAEGSATRRYERHAVTAGVEYRDNLQQDQHAWDETGVLLDDRRASQTAGAFVEDELRVSSRVLLNAGLRWDQYFDTFGGTLSPRLALIVSPMETATIKLLYGQAFRAPNPFELYYDRSPLSAQLGPERIVTYELVWEQRAGRRAQVTTSAFYNRARGLITQHGGSQETLDGLYYGNSGGAGATGLELEVQGELPGRVHGRASCVLQSVEDHVTGLGLSNSPGQLGTVVLDAPINPLGLIVAFNGYLVGERRTVRGASIPASFLADITVSGDTFRFGPEVALVLRNAFDASHGDPGSLEHRQDVIPQDGRTVAVRATWRF